MIGVWEYGGMGINFLHHLKHAWIKGFTELLKKYFV
jgi:hypothetical protein